MSLLDELSTGAWIKWDDLGQGTVVTGTVLNTQMRQATEFQTTKLAFWDDGKPKMQLNITMATALRDPDDPQDDGARSLSINLWSGQKSALVAALKAAGAKNINPGDEFSAVWMSGVGRAGDPRVLAFKLTPGAGRLADSLASDLNKPAPVDPWAAHHAAPAAPAPAPVAAAPAPAAQPAGASPVENARQLLAAGLGVNDVAAATGLSAQIVAALAGTVQSAGPAPF